MSATLRCAYCRHFVYLDVLVCPNCEGELAYHLLSRQFYGVRNGQVIIDGNMWFTCSNREWLCNWLVSGDIPSARCFSCRLTRTSPDINDTIAMEKLAKTEEAKRRLLIQLADLGLAAVPWDAQPGGLGFDLISSLSEGRQVLIGHANGIITLDLAESLDDRREALRVKLGEPYRTMLGHLRHEIGHYFQNVLVNDDDTWGRCRELFGNEQVSYDDALARHYASGAPASWPESFISEYATMHPWEDFAETFAHYLHITGTLQTAAAIGIHLDSEVTSLRDTDVMPRDSYADQPIQQILTDWDWMSQAFNRINRSMGMGDLYPFQITPPVRHKLAFVHDIITRDPATPEQQLQQALALF